jgi:hypothetical protein
MSPTRRGHVIQPATKTWTKNFTWNHGVGAAASYTAIPPISPAQKWRLERMGTGQLLVLRRFSFPMEQHSCLPVARDTFRAHPGLPGTSRFLN